MTITVVIESLTLRRPGADIVAAAAPVLDAVLGQTRTPDEVIVVLVAGEEAAAEALARAYPSVRVAYADRASYFAMKNAGARAASSDVVALSDADSIPSRTWLEHHAAAHADGAVVTAGTTVYHGEGRVLAALSWAGFGIVADAAGHADCYSLNNIAYRREVLLSHPLEEGIRRDGGCYLQHHSMRRAGIRVTYVRDAQARHTPERGTGWVSKHFNRGVDGVQAYELDDGDVLRGSTWVRRFGALAVPPIMARRAALDLRRISRARRQGALPDGTVAATIATMVALRGVELAGGMRAAMGRR